MSSFEALQGKSREIEHLRDAMAVLSWDHQCYMPSGGAGARADQMATISEITHQKFIRDEFGTLLSKAEEECRGADYDSDEAATLRVLRREFDRAVKVPAALVAEETRITSLAHEEWVHARKNNDYKHFQPWLEKVVDVECRIAECRGYKDSIYDTMMDPFEPGMSTKDVTTIFGELRKGLVAIVKEIGESGNPVDDSLIHKNYPIEGQKAIADDVVRAVGYDFNIGRQDIAAHPFCTSFATTDVRITTRYYEDYLPCSMYGSLHEAGHAMYEQGFPEKYQGTALRDAASLGFHESQSRMWENMVGRGRQFVRFYFPTIQKQFPEQLGAAKAEDFYRAVNSVKPSLIRVEADEVTYSLHIMLRFEIEQAMVTGKVKFSELPDLWNSKMQEYIGITPPSDADGVLQDVHWSSGIFGYFPTYALGNLYSAMLWKRINTDLPNLATEFQNGEFGSLLKWLREHVHSQVNKYLPGELIQKITGRGIEASSYLEYLRTKFGEIYSL